MKLSEFAQHLELESRLEDFEITSVMIDGIILSSAEHNHAPVEVSYYLHGDGDFTREDKRLVAKFDPIETTDEVVLEFLGGERKTVKVNQGGEQ